MFKLSLVVTAVTSVLVTLVTGAVAQKAPPEMPLAVICWNEQSKTWMVGHLATIKEDGSATYMSADARLSVTVTPKGVVEPPSNRPANVDCYGKTIDQLRAMGRVGEFQRTR